MILIRRQTTASTLSNMVDALRIRRVSQSLWLRERMVRNVTVVHLYKMRSLFFDGGGGGAVAGRSNFAASLTLLFWLPSLFFLASSLYPFFYIEISCIVAYFPLFLLFPTLLELSHLPPFPLPHPTPPTTDHPGLPAPVLRHSFLFSSSSFKLAVANKHSI